MDDQRRSIEQLFPTPREVLALPVSRSGFIQADIRHLQGNLLVHQELAAPRAAGLSRMCEVVGLRVRSTLR